MTKINESSPQVPTIPREVANAIECLRIDRFASNADVLDYAKTITGAKAMHLRSIPFDTLLAALINGYNVELTSEEAAEKERQEAYDKIRSGYGEKRRKQRTTCSVALENWYEGYADGIRFAVRTLKLDIPEVSA